MKNTLTTVCFTGHRPEHFELTERQAKAILRPAIYAAVRKGATNFISGMQRGIDLWAADIVLELKKTNPKIKLYAAVPFHGKIFTSKWQQADKKHYATVLSQADGVHYCAKQFDIAAYETRNRFMIDRADLVIACWNGKESGGTYNAVKYTESQKKSFVNCFNKKGLLVSPF